MTDHTIPEWAKPLVAARSRGATLQYWDDVEELWADEPPPPHRHFAFHWGSDNYRIKPGTDPGTADPLIWGASTPGTEPIERREDEYVPLTDAEIRVYYHQLSDVTTRSLVLAAHRAGWERRRTP